MVSELRYRVALAVVTVVPSFKVSVASVSANLFVLLLTQAVMVSG
jgi:hypothetical protein